MRIGVLDNRKPNARLLLERLAENLAQRTGARVSLITGKANAAVACEPQVPGQLRQEADVIGRKAEPPSRSSATSAPKTRSAPWSRKRAGASAASTRR